MKNNIYHKLILLLLVIGFTACTNNENERSSAGETLNTETIQVSLNESLDRIEQRMDEVEGRLENTSSEMKEEWETRMAELRAESDEIKNELSSMKAETAEVVEKSQEELNQRLAEIDAKLDKARLLTVETREEFRVEAEQQLEMIDAKVARLESVMNNAGDEVNAEYLETLSELKKMRANIVTQWEEIEIASEQEFENLKDNFSNAISSLDSRIDQTVTDLESTFDTE